ERDLRGGRLSYRWADVLAWSNPPAPGVHTSPNAETLLDLPLHIVAPLFIQQRPSGLRKKAAVPADIPDVFSGQPATAAPEPMATNSIAPASTAAAAVAAPAPAAAASRPPQTLGELFGIPQKQNWTPNELVQKTANLPGLAGALIALQDGFLVASHLPASWKADTVSAFLPQVFGRMNQYCREIGIGEPRAITFTLEEGTLQIYRAGIILLAVLVKPGATVPEGAIGLLTAELGRHTR
ncbi:MAG TPA: roadblock/LC7 domain-containing protein, partial [Methylomirabilota bacterium]|nr:roadblock/LC7 domain-containing protein [Methylomirabilota bacterium]